MLKVLWPKDNKWYDAIIEATKGTHPRILSQVKYINDGSYEVDVPQNRLFRKGIDPTMHVSRASCQPALENEIDTKDPSCMESKHTSANTSSGSSSMRSPNLSPIPIQPPTSKRGKAARTSVRKSLDIDTAIRAGCDDDADADRVDKKTFMRQQKELWAQFHKQKKNKKPAAAVGNNTVAEHVSHGSQVSNAAMRGKASVRESPDAPIDRATLTLMQTAPKKPEVRARLP